MEMDGGNEGCSLICQIDRRAWVAFFPEAGLGGVSIMQGRPLPRGETRRFHDGEL
jgi:hypothetical protein